MTTSDHWTVLIIDDEQDIRDVAALALSDAGYRVETAEDGNRGVALCETFAPRIVITDIRMPGMDGIQVLETIKKRFPDTEVIVSTAFGDMETAIRALRLDASDFITKPIHAEALMVALQRARDRYRIRKQLKDHARQLEEGLDRRTRQLADTAAYMERLIENAIDGIIGCDAQGRVVTFNRSMEQMLGIDRDRVRNQSSLKALFDEAAYQRFRNDLMGEAYGGINRLVQYETTLLGHMEKPVPVALSAVVITETDNEADLVCFCRDLRQIHRLEREMADQARLLHQDKMMSLGRLAASVAHEINNPLAGILNYLRLMQRSFAKGPLSTDKHESFTRYLETVVAETDRCSKIVGSLLTFSRKSPVAVKPIFIGTVLDRSIILARHRLELGNVAMEVRIDPDLPRIQGDANQLQQCLLNLIFNAADAMPDGGTLTISATLEKSPATIVVRITDTGIGIKEEDMPHIFEPFFTTKEEGHGLGLGLSTTYGIVERNGGTLTAHSRPGNGTTFEIRIPTCADVGKKG